MPSFNRTEPDAQNIPYTQQDRPTKHGGRMMMPRAPPSSFTASTRPSLPPSKASTLSSRKVSDQGTNFTAPSERHNSSKTASSLCTSNTSSCKHKHNGGGGSHHSSASSCCCSSCAAVCSRLAHMEDELHREHEQQRLTQEELARASRELRLLRQVLQKRVNRGLAEDGVTAEQQQQDRGVTLPSIQRKAKDARSSVTTTSWTTTSAGRSGAQPPNGHGAHQKRYQSDGSTILSSLTASSCTKN